MHIYTPRHTLHTVTENSYIPDNGAHSRIKGKIKCSFGNDDDNADSN